MGSFPEQRLGIIIDSNLYNNVFIKLFSWLCSFSMHRHSQPPARWYTLSVKTSIDPLQLVCHVVQMTDMLENKRRTARRQRTAFHLVCASMPGQLYSWNRNTGITLQFYPFFSHLFSFYPIELIKNYLFLRHYFNFKICCQSCEVIFPPKTVDIDGIVLETRLIDSDRWYVDLETRLDGQ